MGRPAKNNAEYFPHKTGMISHRKVLILRNKFGSVLGYAFWSLMLEWLTERDGLEWEDSELEMEMFASTLGVPGEQIREMVDFSIRITLLSKTESGFIYSESLQENLDPVFEKRNKEREKSKTRKRAENGTFKNNVQDVVVSVAETTKIKVDTDSDYPHSRVKESKVNKSKKESIYAFDDFWNAYDKKKGNMDATKKKWNSLTEQTHSTIMKHIPKLLLETPDKQYRPNPLTYLNGKLWMNDVDANTNQRLPDEVLAEREARRVNMLQRTQGMEYNREYPMNFHPKISVYHLEHGMYDQLK